MMNHRRADVGVAGAVKVGDIILLTFVFLSPVDALDVVDGFTDADEGDKESDDGGTCGKHVPQATSEHVFGLVAEHAGHPASGFFNCIVFFHDSFVFNWLYSGIVIK